MRYEIVEKTDKYGTEYYIRRKILGIPLYVCEEDSVYFLNVLITGVYLLMCILIQPNLLYYFGIIPVLLITVPFSNFISKEKYTSLYLAKTYIEDKIKFSKNSTKLV